MRRGLYSRVKSARTAPMPAETPPPPPPAVPHTVPRTPPVAIWSLVLAVLATAGLILGYIALAVGIMGIPLLVSMIHSDRERLQRLSTERKEIASNDGQIKSPSRVRGPNCRSSINKHR